MKINQRKHLFALSLLLLFAAFIFAPAISDKQDAKACWNNTVIECFDRPAASTGWANPVGTNRWFRFNPNPEHPQSWGVQDRVYSSTFSELCNNDIKSLWCIGGSRDYDPDVHPYLRNMDSYFYYGPFSLTDAEFAIMRFQLLCESEYLGDSIFWGVADNANIPNAATILLDTSFSGSTVEFFGQPWHWIEVDFDSLHDLDGNDASAIGMPQLWAFWWFHSNSNTVSTPPGPLHNGAFVDNVMIEWDDGLIDIAASSLSLLHEDSSAVSGDLVVYDVVRNSVMWNTCSGSIEEYPDCRITVTATDPLGFDIIIMDSVFSHIIQDSTYRFYTDTWTLERAGNYTIYFTIDPLDEIDESIETNNTMSMTTYAAPPNPHPEFIWIAPNEDSALEGNQSVWLRWEAYDVEESAYINLYFDNDTLGCQGTPIPQGLNLREHDGPDSLEWDIHGWALGTSRWPFVRLLDTAWDTCFYAPNPVTRSIEAAQEMPTGVPNEFFLSQNYPNPFNPDTEISFGITHAGLVTLRIYDLLGRQVAELVNENLTPGTYLSRFNGRSLSSGVYLYTLTSSEGVLNNKMVLLK